MPDLSQFTEALLSAAKAEGAEASDAIATQGHSLSIDVRDGKLEQAERSESVDIGLRVLIGKRQACVSASDTGSDTIQALAERAVAMARIAPEDPNIGLATPDQLATDTDTTALDLAERAPEPAPADLQDIAARTEAAALSFKDISQVQSATSAFSQTSMHIAATNGFSAGYARSSHGTYCVAITGEGTDMERDYFGESRIYRGDLPSPEDIGKKAAERTLQRAGARKPPTGAFPVLYDERVASSLIGHLLQASNGASIARGSSWLRDKMGEQILPKGMTVTEDPHRVRVSGSKLFDGEGLPTRKRHIVKDGVLQSWTLDLANARKLGLESTGNAGRGTSAPPSPTLTNIDLSQGSESRYQLIADMGTGLLVTSLIGSSINATTGDYSRGASGFWVENGEIAYPVNECTIAGNLIHMLMSLRPANDARTWTSRVIPSLLVEGLTIAGAS
ncbi:MAG: TldD/PmbA family protein [Silicimonas sp.]|nr:TldD/PmbA family protein [Silicimonas sp.]